MNKLITRGVYFDLLPIFVDLNRRFFNENINAQLTWGIRRRAVTASKRSIRLGSYSPHRKIIRDQPLPRSGDRAKHLR